MLQFPLRLFKTAGLLELNYLCTMRCRNPPLEGHPPLGQSCLDFDMRNDFHSGASFQVLPPAQTAETEDSGISLPSAGNLPLYSNRASVWRYSDIPQNPVPKAECPLSQLGAADPYGPVRVRGEVQYSFSGFERGHDSILHTK